MRKRRNRPRYYWDTCRPVTLSEAKGLLPSPCGLTARHFFEGNREWAHTGVRPY